MVVIGCGRVVVGVVAGALVVVVLCVVVGVTPAVVVVPGLVDVVFSGG